MLSELDRRYDAAIAAVTGPGGKVEVRPDEQGRMIPAQLPGALPAFG